MDKAIVVSDNYLSDIEKYLQINIKKRVLFIYGENSIKSYNIYSDVISLLDKYDLEVEEIGGIERNPILDKYNKTLNSEWNPDIILAIGGGSVLDVAKYLKSRYCQNGYFYSVLTIVGSDSYRSELSYFSDKDGNVRVFNCKTKPNKVLLSPGISTYVPPNYTAYSSIAIFIKALFSFTESGNISMDNLNRMIELIEETLIDPFDESKRKELINWEIKTDLLPHNLHLIITNVVTKLFNIPFGAALSIITPAYFKLENLFETIFNNKEFLFYDFKRFSEVPDIERLEWWLHSLGSPVKFSEYNIDENSFPKITETTLNLCKDLGIIDVSETRIMKLLKLAL